MRRLEGWELLNKKRNSDILERITLVKNSLIRLEKNAFLACYTATRLPVQLVFSSEFSTRDEAFNAERQIKGWSRKRQGAFIREDWIAISFYAKRHKAFQ